MSYQALYRVWRPQTFDELIGQPMISETLKNAVASGQLSHAYLFTGPRGTGKTSAAKILAKAVNCLHPKDGNPCNACELCQEITLGQLSDVIEIDAASNNGVDEIRDLRDNVRYAASQAAYKVYIIDEVHMLTTGAFNALLKTLEEPPERVIFIMATTEPHKIPATILSRTQRFDFHRIQSSDLIRRMKQVLDHDKIAYEEEALAIIARSANGGMRDSLSLLDQALSYNNDLISVDSALEVSGSLSQLVFVDYLVAVSLGESAKALEILKEEFHKGKQAGRFIEELSLFARDMLLTIYSQDNQTLLSEKELAPLYAHVENNFYYQLIDALSEAQAKMRFSNQGDLYVEVMTVQLAQRDSQTEEGSNQAGSQPSAEERVAVQKLKDQVNDLEEQVAQLRSQLQGQAKQVAALESGSNKREAVAVNALNEDQTSGERPAVKAEVHPPRKRPVRPQTAYKANLDEIYQALNEATHEDINSLRGQWEAILSRLSPQQRAMYTGTQPLAAGAEWALISFQSREHCGAIQHDHQQNAQMEAIAEEVTGKKRQFTYVLASEWHDIRTQYTILRKQNNNQPVAVNLPPRQTVDLSDQEADTSQTDGSGLPADTPSSLKESDGSGSEQVSNTPTALVEDGGLENSGDGNEATDVNNINDVNDAGNETEAEVSIDQESSSNLASENPSRDETLPSSIEGTVEDIQSTMPHPTERMGQVEEKNSSEEPPQSELVAKAIELFGEDHVNIYEK